MQKATMQEVELIAKSMNMKVDVVQDAILGMNFSTYAELTMAVLICQQPLPVEKLSRGGTNNSTQGGVR